jgi:metal-dependent hydrolase (beta-lactamase superfamily II)
MHAESQVGSQSRSVLVDFGYTPDALLNNLDLLKIDPALIDALVLSHGHYDHFGGLSGFLAATKGQLRKTFHSLSGARSVSVRENFRTEPNTAHLTARQLSIQV